MFSSSFQVPDGGGTCTYTFTRSIRLLRSIDGVFANKKEPYLTITYITDFDGQHSK